MELVDVEMLRAFVYYTFNFVFIHLFIYLLHSTDVYMLSRNSIFNVAIYIYKAEGVQLQLHVCPPINYYVP